MGEAWSMRASSMLTILWLGCFSPERISGGPADSSPIDSVSDFFEDDATSSADASSMAGPWSSSTDAGIVDASTQPDVSPLDADMYSDAHVAIGSDCDRVAQDCPPGLRCSGTSCGQGTCTEVWGRRRERSVCVGFRLCNRSRLRRPDWRTWFVDMHRPSTL